MSDETQTAAENGQGDAEPARAGSFCRKAFICALYVVFSVALVRSNKYLLAKGRFPHPLCLSAMHLAAATATLSIYYAALPRHFPGLANVEGRRCTVATYFLPISLSCAGFVALSNEALLYSSVPFVQFLKQANVVITFTMSWLWGLQSVTMLRLVLIAWIVAGSSVSVAGEFHFVWVGFLLQILSQFAECLRSVLGEVVLTGAGLSLDPLSYVLFEAPLCFVELSAAALLMWHPATVLDFRLWWHLILPNSMLSPLLSVMQATVIKELSAVGFILLGTIKYITVVLISWAFFDEECSFQQAIGFAVTLAGVFAWTYTKAVPSSPLVQAAERLLGARQPDAPSERTALRAKQALAPPAYNDKA